MARTHVGDADAGAKGDLALGLDGMQLGQDAARVGGKCGEHLAITVRGDMAVKARRGAGGSSKLLGKSHSMELRVLLAELGVQCLQARQAAAKVLAIRSCPGFVPE